MRAGDGYGAWGASVMLSRDDYRRAQREANLHSAVGRRKSQHVCICGLIGGPNLASTAGQRAFPNRSTVSQFVLVNRSNSIETFHAVCQDFGNRETFRSLSPAREHLDKHSCPGPASMSATHC